MLARRLVRAGGKVLVAAAAPAAFGNHDLFIRFPEVVDQLARLRIVKRRPHRHLQRDRFAVQPRTVRAHPVLPALRLVLRVIAEMNQSIMPLCRLHHYVAAAPTVAAGRPTPRYKFLAPESHAAVAAVASLYPDFRFINKHCLLLSILLVRNAAAVAALNL